MCQLYVYDGNLLVHWNMSRTLRNNKLVNRTFVKTATIILFFFLFYWPKISFPAKIIKEDKAQGLYLHYFSSRASLETTGLWFILVVFGFPFCSIWILKHYDEKTTQYDQWRICALVINVNEHLQYFLLFLNDLYFFTSRFFYRLNNYYRLNWTTY